MFSQTNKSISWKTALGVVVFLHVFGYVALTQYSSYRKDLAQKLKEKKEALFANSKNKSDWPQNNGKLITTYPVPLKTSVPQKEDNKDLQEKIDYVANKWEDFKKIAKNSGDFVSKQIKFDDLDNEKVVNKEKPTPVTSIKKETAQIKPKPKSSPARPLISANKPSTPKQIIQTPRPTPVISKPQMVKQTPQTRLTPKPQQYTEAKPQNIQQIPSYITQIAAPKEGAIQTRHIVIEPDGTVNEVRESREIISSQIVL